MRKQTSLLPLLVRIFCLFTTNSMSLVSENCEYEEIPVMWNRKTKTNDDAK